jgi:ATP/maltotriose-dependent transcriptional regulator MalT
MFMQTDREEARQKLNDVLPRLDLWSRGLALFFRGAIADNQGELEESRRDIREAQQVFRAAGDRWGLAMTIRVDAATLSAEGDYTDAIEAYQESLRLIRELGSIDDEPETLIRIASERARAGEVEQARAEILDALAMAQDYGQAESIVWAYCALAELSVSSGDLVGARAELEQARTAQLAKQSGPPQIRTVVYSQLADIEILSGAPDAGRECIRQAIECALQVEDLPMLAISVQRSAGLAMYEGDPEQAAYLLGIATRLRGMPDRSATDPLRTEQRAREALGTAAYEEAYHRGARLTRSEAIAAAGSS